MHKKGYKPTVNIGDIVTFRLGNSEDGKIMATGVYRWKVKRVRTLLKKKGYDLKAVKGNDAQGYKLFSIIHVNDNSVVVDRICLHDALIWGENQKQNRETVSTEQKVEEK